jgi:uncharacterized protein (DUF1501 family)
MNRRDLLKGCAAMGAMSLTSGLIAAPATQNRLLLVFLRGGYDACNLLIPTASNFYYESRPNIAIARPGGADDQQAALLLNADWGLHPALRETIYPLYQSGEVAFIPFAGTDDVSRSHFETQDSIELGQPLNGRRNLHSGFLNRLSAQINGTSAMSFTDQLPIVMQGNSAVANTALRALGRSNMDPRQSAIISQMYSHTALAQQVNEGFTVRDEVIRSQQEALQEEMNSANRNALSTKGFEQEAKRMARLMRDKYALGFVDVGGWDTHVNQGGATGTLANKFEELGRGLVAYRKEMGSVWSNTTVVVISEFGRTFRENGKRGTDHGHGSVYWVLGGGIKGGRIAGEQVRLEAGKLFQNRDYPVLNEYRAVLGGLFSRIYGLNGSQLEQIFSGIKARDLALL